MPGRREIISLTQEEQRNELENGWTLHVASNGNNGHPHLVAMWYVMIDGKICFTTFRKSQKIANLKRNDKLTVMLESGDVYEELKGIVIEGKAEIIEEISIVENVLEHVSAKYNHVPFGSVEAKAMNAQAPKRVAVRILPLRIISWDHKKLNGMY